MDRYIKARARVDDVTREVILELDDGEQLNLGYLTARQMEILNHLQVIEIGDTE